MKNILLIGTGRFGRHIAVQLSQLGHQVMAVDTNEERINDVLPYVTNAQIGDSTNAEFLRSLGIGNFDVCIVTISDNFQNSLETTSLLKELGAKCVVSRAERDVQAKFLLRNGADHIVYPEKQVAKWAAIRYTADHIFDYIEIDEQHAILRWKYQKAGSGKHWRTEYPQKVWNQHSWHQAFGKNRSINYTGYGAVRGNNDFSVGRIQSAAKVLPNLNGR